MIKLIVSDMDGTLLDDEKKIAPGFFELLPKLHERGIRFVVASGRQYPSLRKQFAAHLKDVAIIAENGAFVVWDEKELYARPMGREKMQRCLKVLSRFPSVEPMVCAKYYSYTERPVTYEYLRGEKFRYEMRLTDSLYDLNDQDILRVSVVEHKGGQESMNACYETLYPLLKEDFALAVSGASCMDIGLHGVHKGSAVEALQKMWGISKEETMVFGDQFNDVEMLQRAKYSFAMEGAAEGVKRYANFTAGSNNRAGVVQAIRQVLKMDE